MGHDPGASAAVQLGGVARVVGVSVREQDGPYVPDRPVRLTQGLLDACGPARQAGVDENHAVVDHHEVRVDEQDPDLEDTVGNLKHVQHSTEVATAKINLTELPLPAGWRSPSPATHREV